MMGAKSTEPKLGVFHSGDTTETSPITILIFREPINWSNECVIYFKKFSFMDRNATALPSLIQSTAMQSVHLEKPSISP